MSAPQDERAEEHAIVRQHIDQLAEHFDTVQVFVTRVTQGGEYTVRIDTGTGNWFARYGQIRQWVEMEDEEARHIARRVAGQSEDN